MASIVCATELVQFMCFLRDSVLWWMLWYSLFFKTNMTYSVESVDKVDIDVISTFVGVAHRM